MKARDAINALGFLGAVFLQLLMLVYYPYFARSFDVVLIFLVLLGVMGKTEACLAFALFSGLLFDLYSPLTFLNSFIYLSVALVVCYLIPRNFLAYGTIIFLVFVSALIFRVVSSYLLVSITFIRLPASFLLELSLVGVLTYVTVSFLISLRMDRILGEKNIAK